MPADKHIQFLCFLGFLAVIAISFVIPAAAQDEDENLGLLEYELACMPCHGIDGRGDGPKAKNLKIPPADLTKIAKANNGKFPFDEMVEIVDGRTDVAAHGAREMPVWGDRYRIAAEPDESLREIDSRARTQIQALVEYLETIQEE